MCNARNHGWTCTCGFGGEGHLGGGGYRGGSGLALRPSAATPAAHYGQSMRLLALSLGRSLTFPTACRYCGHHIYLYAHPNGGFAIFDDLGVPWPKHQCAGYDGQSRLEMLSRFSVKRGTFHFIHGEVPVQVLFDRDRIEGMVLSCESMGNGINRIEVFTGSHRAKLMCSEGLLPGTTIHGVIRFVKRGYFLTQLVKWDVPGTS